MQLPMPKIALALGAALVAVGVWAYAASAPGASPTALIPAAFGAMLIVCGVVGLRGGTARRHAMHIAAFIAMMGALGAAGQLIAQPAAGSEHADVARTAGILLLLLSGIFLALAFRSFSEARRSRTDVDIRS